MKAVRVERLNLFDSHPFALAPGPALHKYTRKPSNRPVPSRPLSATVDRWSREATKPRAAGQVWMCLRNCNAAINAVEPRDCGAGPERLNKYVPRSLRWQQREWSGLRARSCCCRYTKNSSTACMMEGVAPATKRDSYHKTISSTQYCNSDLFMESDGSICRLS